MKCKNHLTGIFCKNFVGHKNESIDNLYDALRRRNLDCFKSFLAALLEHEYGNLWMAIMEIGKTILSKRNHQL